MPIAATIASEFAATGRPSTRRFQTFEAGKIGHDESDGGGPGVGIGAGGWVGAAVGFAVGVVVAVGEAVVGAEEAGAVGPLVTTSVDPGVGAVEAYGVTTPWLGSAASTPVDVGVADPVGPFSPFDKTGTGRGLARTATTMMAAAAPNHANAASRFPRSDMTPA
jgi:hypothetical protein